MYGLIFLYTGLDRNFVGNFNLKKTLLIRFTYGMWKFSLVYEKILEFETFLGSGSFGCP